METENKCKYNRETIRKYVNNIRKNDIKKEVISKISYENKGRWRGKFDVTREKIEKLHQNSK
jgi:hypothetical protein